MTQEEQKNPFDAPPLSVLAQEKTYGERKYDFLINTVINFWVNLIVSAGFTYWVSHSKTELKIPFTDKPLKRLVLWGKEIGSPSNAQSDLGGGIYKLFSKINLFDATKNHEGVSNRDTYSGNAAGVLTLVTGGHFVVIPSIWLGAKIKAPFVEWLDRRHYGEEGMQDPSLKARHAALEVEERPTFLGAVVGRLGSIIATQTASYAVGNPSNLIRFLGKKMHLGALSNFQGIDEIAGVMGDKAGEGVTQLLPTQTQALDERLQDANYGWSKSQHTKAQNEGRPLLDQDYHGATQHLGKYMAQDVLYTVVTSVSLTPVINLMKRYIPGLTYTPKPKPGTDMTDAARIHIPANPIAAQPRALTQTPALETPDAKVSNIKPESTLEPRPDMALARAGA